MSGLATDLFGLDPSKGIVLTRPLREIDPGRLDILDHRGLLPLLAWLGARERGAETDSAAPAPAGPEGGPRDATDSGAIEPASGGAAAPAGTEERLRGVLATGRAGALRWQAAIEIVVDALRPLGIEPVLLKGADLGFHHYPEPGLRTMTDLDVLVPPGRLDDVAAALEPRGFSERTHSYSRQWYLDCRRCLPPTVHEELGIHLDVHGCLLQPYSPFRLGYEETMAGARPALFPGALRLAPEVLFWHLAAHCFVIHLGAADARERARVDLLALLASDGVDAGRLARIAERTRTGWAVHRAVGLVDDAPGAAELKAALGPVRPFRHRAWRAFHAFRHAFPFLFAGRTPPPDAWIQVGRRARRLVRSLGER